MKAQQKIVRISKINKIEGFIVFCTFSNSEYRHIDFEQLFQKWKVKKGDPEYPLLDKSEFKKVQLSNGTLSWNNVTVSLIDEDYKEQSYPYEIDPIVLYQNSQLDFDKLFDNIGLILKNERKKSGLTKSDLAKKSGISEEYITKLEDKKTNFELLVLRDLINKGFGKQLKISIE